MKRTAALIAVVLLAASTSPLLARGGQFGGPIGPGSRDGLQPSVNDVRPNAFAYDAQRSVVKMRSRKLKQR